MLVNNSVIRNKKKNSNLEKCLIGFEKKAVLNSGCFGKIYTMKSKNDGEKYAVKMLDINNLKKKLKIPRDSIINSIKNEAKILSKMKHENIVRYYQTKTTNNRIYIFMELIRGGTLESYIKTGFIKPKLIIKLTTELLHVLKYIHFSIKTIHRDIKPDNIFIENESIKLGDFGVATSLLNHRGEYTQSNDVHGRGHIYYRSPESIQSCIYTNMHDLWAVGCVLLEMMSGHLIPSMITDTNVFALSTQFDEIVEQICEDYNNVGIETITKGFLKKDYNKRMNIDTAIQWITKIVILPPITPVIQKNFFTSRPWTR